MPRVVVTRVDVKMGVDRSASRDASVVEDARET
jgi:hypothetical protein